MAWMTFRGRGTAIGYRPPTTGCRTFTSEPWGFSPREAEDPPGLKPWGSGWKQARSSGSPARTRRVNGDPPGRLPGPDADTLDDMTRRGRIGTVGGLLVLMVGLAIPASAQLVFEAAGERALGMAGAFVAVADDATAVHWNPAGLSAGQLAGVTIGWHQFQVGNQDAWPTDDVRRGRSTFTSLGTWPIGIAYGTTQRHRVSPGPGAGDVLSGESLRVSHVGVTVLQTVMEGLVVGSTVKFMRGSAAGGDVDAPTAGQALDRLADFDGRSRFTVDLDLGLMASAPHVRLGLAVKNLRAPEFGDGANGVAIRLPRQTRMGLAVLPADGLTLAMDLDLNTVDLMGDLRRMLAAGGEWALGSRIQVRSGVRWNLALDRRVTGAVGASVSVRQGLWIDGHYGRGQADESREFGVALRAGF